MFFRTANLNARGFSLVELMIVVGIIGILATMGTAKMKSMRVKATQLSAKVTLNQLHTLATSFHSENDTYIDPLINGNFLVRRPVAAYSCSDKKYCLHPNSLGFSIPNCLKRSYNIFYNGTSESAFLGTAIEILPSNNDNCLPNRTVYFDCASAPDRFRLAQDKILIHTPPAGC